MMQNLKRVLAISFIVCSCLGCRQENTLTKFKGRIENSAGGEFNVQLKYFDHTSLEEARFSVSAPIGPNGEFELETDKVVDNVWYVFMWIGNEMSRVSVFPGDDLTISVDADRFDESIVFKGKGAEKNNYKTAKYLRNEKRDKSIEPDRFKLPFDAFIASILESNKNHIESLDSVFAGQEKDVFYEMEKFNH